MSNRNGDQPAYPCQALDASGMPGFQMDFGLTKREQFAMAAMQGLLSNPAMVNESNSENLRWLNETAAEIADGQLAELERTSGGSNEPA